MDQNQMMLEYLMSMGALQPEQDDIARQRQMADQLRQGAQTPQMRQSGRVNVAANPLEFLASVGSGYGAQQMDKQADAANKAYRGKRMDQLGRMRDRFYGGQGGGLGAYGAPDVMSPDGTGAY